MKDRGVEIAERIRHDVSRFFKAEETALYGLRTLASAIELGLIGSPDPETAAEIAETARLTDTAVMEAFSSEDGRKILTGLGIYQDRMTVEHWVHGGTERQPLLSEHTRKRIIDAAERHVFGNEDRHHAEGVRYAAILFRSGLIPDIPKDDLSAFLDRLDRYFPETVDRGADMLERELAISPNASDADLPVPHATYGLFTLSDAKILLDHRNGQTHEQTSGKT